MTIIVRSAVCILTLSLLSLLFQPAPVSAVPQAGDPPAKENLVSVNPFLIMFGWLNAEFERRISPNSTLGVSGSYLSLNDGDETYAGGQFFYRFYPQNDAPAGFFFGGGLGFNNVTVEEEFTDTEESGSFFNFGITVGYTWLLGDNRGFAVSLGAGVQRLFGDELDDMTMTLPVVRIVNVGVAF